MKILKLDLKHNFVKIEVETLNDLWHLSHIIEPHDIVGAKTERKIRIGSQQQAVKKKMFLKVEVEKIEFHEFNNLLRVSGKIVSGPEDLVGVGDFHTINLDIGTTFVLEKKEWPSYLVKKLKESAQEKEIKSLLVVFDRESALFVLLRNRDYTVLKHLHGDVQKKADFAQDSKVNFFAIISKHIQELLKQMPEIKHVIVASPSFWNEYLLKELPDDLKKRVITASCSYANENGVEEVLRRPELSKVLEQHKLAMEERLIEEMKIMLARNKASYGLEKVKEDAEQGKVEKLLVASNFLVKARQEGFWQELDSLMLLVESMNGKIYIFESSEQEILEHFKGIVAILRWN